MSLLSDLWTFCVSFASAPPLGANDGPVRPEDYPHREGCVRDKWEAQKPTTALVSGLNRRILAWSGKRTLCRRSVKKRGRFACKPAKAPVLAMPNNVPAKATCGWFWVPFATKRYKASAAYAAVKAALPTKKRQTTPVEDCDRYFLRPKSTKYPAGGDRGCPSSATSENAAVYNSLLGVMPGFCANMRTGANTLCSRVRPSRFLQGEDRRSGVPMAQVRKFFVLLPLVRREYEDEC